MIVADGHIEEVSSVMHRIIRNLVKSLIDITEIASLDLICDGNQACPLGRTATSTTHNVPADTARIGAAAPGIIPSRRRLGHINQRTGTRARLESDVRNAPHVSIRPGGPNGTPDIGAARRQDVLEGGP